MNPILRGALVMGFVVGALFFLRSWHRTRQRLFLFFAIAFLIEAVARTALALDDDPLERRLVFYLPRLVAYSLIIAGIVSQNLPRRPKG